MNQDGYKIFENITLKVKPFFYGRRISEFHQIDDNFSCNSSILGILADGNVVPCCLAYDESISMGRVNKSSLEQILKDGSSFLKNLRTKNGENMKPVKNVLVSLLNVELLQEIYGMHCHQEYKKLLIF